MIKIGDKVIPKMDCWIKIRTIFSSKELPEDPQVFYVERLEGKASRNSENIYDCRCPSCYIYVMIKESDLLKVPEYD